MYSSVVYNTSVAITTTSLEVLPERLTARRVELWLANAGSNPIVVTLGGLGTDSGTKGIYLVNGGSPICIKYWNGSLFANTTTSTSTLAIAECLDRPITLPEHYEEDSSSSSSSSSSLSSSSQSSSSLSSSSLSSASSVSSVSTASSQSSSQSSESSESSSLSSVSSQSSISSSYSTNSSQTQSSTSSMIGP